jgi:hypothetical protein
MKLELRMHASGLAWLDLPEPSPRLTPERVPGLQPLASMRSRPAKLPRSRPFRRLVRTADADAAGGFSVGGIGSAGWTGRVFEATADVAGAFAAAVTGVSFSAATGGSSVSAFAAGDAEVGAVVAAAVAVEVASGRTIVGSVGCSAAAATGAAALGCASGVTAAVGASAKCDLANWNDPGWIAYPKIKHIATNTMHSAAMLSGFFSFGGAAATIAAGAATMGSSLTGFE